MKQRLIACAAILTMALGLSLSPFAAHEAAATDREAIMATEDPENTLIITLDDGEVIIRLRPDLAPNHVTRIKELAREGYYDGVVFHRVIEGFMAQTGDGEFGSTIKGLDLRRAGTGGSGRNLKAEFSNASFERGVMGMARAQNPNSADSQFFIMFDSAPHLNGQYTIVGETISGMEHIDGLKRGAPGSGAVSDPDKMNTVRVAADAG